MIGQADDKSRRKAPAAPVRPEDALGADLRAMFEAVAGAELPEHLVELVDELEEKRAAGRLEIDKRG